MGIPVDGRLVAQALYTQKSDGLYGGYRKVDLKEGETIVMVSASISNSYLILGYKETQ